MIRVKNINVKINEDLIKAVCKKLNIKKEEIITYNIIKKSIDARKGNNIHYCYELDLSLKNENINNKDVTKSVINDFKYEITGNKMLKNRPVIVGSGPAGLFCAYILAENNYKPIIIERGEKIDDRIKRVNEFWEKGVLNINSNVQFGEGGAGTFSDGKLNTLVKDKKLLQKKVFEVFTLCGAPKEILYEKNPHIGTDKLVDVVKNMRNRIIENGGEFRFNTCLTSLIIDNNKIIGIEVNNNETINSEILVLAIGHSARDTFKMLHKYNLNMKSKPFAIGLRVEHKRKFIDYNQYKDYYKYLPPASYKLTYKASDNRGVYSFCMCPGGYIVNASSEKGHLVINGMSYYKRDSENSNSALVVTIDENDYGHNLFDGMEYQRKLEKKAFMLENGNIPVQLIKDFFDSKKTTKLEDIKPMVKGKYSLSKLNDILDDFIIKDLKEGINHFDKKISGFKDGLLLGIESRTSSPIRILRDEKLMSNIYGIYPIGEGAGYAGGITTSAMDGIRASLEIAKIYKGVENE